MRVELSEEAMYRRMDWRDRLQFLIPLSSMACCVGIMLAASGAGNLLCFMVLCGAMVVLLCSALLYRKISGLIMPVSGCYLEIRDARFLLVQPFIRGRYESCCIELGEVEKLVYDGRKGGFYLKISSEGKSWIRDGEKREGRKRQVLYVNPFGYTRKQLESAYEILEKRVPVTAIV